MASSNQFLIVFAIAAVLVPTVVVATEYNVGDDLGWTNIGVNYTTWAAGKVFRLGDTLVFKYQSPPNNVHAVNGQDFQSCNTTTVGLTTGNDKITLDTPGKKWYMCSFEQHCADGQKLVINVDATPTPTSAPAPAPNAAFALGANLYIFVAAMVGVAMML